MISKQGTLEVGEQRGIDIFFEPLCGGYVTRDLIFTLSLNPNKYVVSLHGTGVVPQLIIKESDVIFEPTLPYTNNYTKSLKIENASTFPLEFFFSDFDW